MAFNPFILILQSTVTEVRIEAEPLDGEVEHLRAHVALRPNAAVLLLVEPTVRFRVSHRLEGHCSNQLSALLNKTYPSHV